MLQLKAVDGTSRGQNLVVTNRDCVDDICVIRQKPIDKPARSSRDLNATDHTRRCFKIIDLQQRLKLLSPRSIHAREHKPLLCKITRGCDVFKAQRQANGRPYLRSRGSPSPDLCPLCTITHLDNTRPRCIGQIVDRCGGVQQGVVIDRPQVEREVDRIRGPGARDEHAGACRQREGVGRGVGDDPGAQRGGERLECVPEIVRVVCRVDRSLGCRRPIDVLGDDEPEQRVVVDAAHRHPLLDEARRRVLDQQQVAGYRGGLQGDCRNLVRDVVVDGGRIRARPTAAIALDALPLSTGTQAVVPLEEHRDDSAAHSTWYIRAIRCASRVEDLNNCRLGCGAAHPGEVAIDRELVGPCEERALGDINPEEGCGCNRRVQRHEGDHRKEPTIHHDGISLRRDP